MCLVTAMQRSMSQFRGQVVVYNGPMPYIEPVTSWTTKGSDEPFLKIPAIIAIIWGATDTK